MGKEASREVLLDLQADPRLGRCANPRRSFRHIEAM
jgi:hypothetical protein